jgi:hypothetical protein
MSNLRANASLHWNSLSEYQKANVKRTFKEFLYLTGTLLLLYLAKGLAEDDDELKENILFNMYMYQNDRLWTEIATYTPIYGWFNESSKLLRSPAASYSVMSDITKLGYNVFLYPFRDTEEHKFRSGVHYGENKITQGIKNILPFVRQYERLKTLDENNKYYKLF